jgi:ribosomal protein S18 acetylase RimI-like enzyme
MTVTAESFRPVDGEARRLTRHDIIRVNRLYAAEGGPLFYTAGHLAEGVYYGVFLDGRLVSIAGTHVCSPTEGIAVVGNVFTHPAYRNRGLAKLATGVVTATLLQRCPQVYLTVESTNIPAIKVYDALGYRESCTLYETPVTRREPKGTLALWRQTLARWRGRREGVEAVVRR